MSSESFFADLHALTSFEAVLDSQNYHPLPDDWVIYVADVRNSTEAIRRGLYRAVNMVGAACITAVLNRCPGVALPFVFGGDGTTLASPATLAPQISRELQGVAAMAKKQFALELRIGRIPINELRASGFIVEVAKYRMAESNHLAMLGGNGLMEAERRIKASGSAYLILSDGPAPDADVSGLSCRWEPLRSVNGEILTLLIQSRSTGTRRMLLPAILLALARIDGPAGDKLNPVKPSGLHTRWPPKTLALESRTHAGTAAGFHVSGRRCAYWLIPSAARLFSIPALPRPGSTRTVTNNPPFLGRISGSLTACCGWSLTFRAEKSPPSLSSSQPNTVGAPSSMARIARAVR